MPYSTETSPQRPGNASFNISAAATSYPGLLDTGTAVQANSVFASAAVNRRTGVWEKVIIFTGTAADVLTLKDHDGNTIPGFVFTIPAAPVFPMTFEINKQVDNGISVLTTGTIVGIATYRRHSPVS